MTRIENAARFARMARLVPPKQIMHRLRLRAQRQVFESAGSCILHGLLKAKKLPDGKWPKFESLDASGPAANHDWREMAAGRFELLGHAVELDQNWASSLRGQSHLWRFTFHYSEWAWSFADKAEESARTAFANLFRRWLSETTTGAWDEWAPYVVALRSWALMGVYDSLIAGSEIEAEAQDLLRKQHVFMRLHLEQDIRGNHLIKNLKALVGGAVWFGDDKELQVALDQLVSEIGHQVLADGGHYERSPAYHCQVLGDLVDVENLLRAAQLSVPPELASSIAAMRVWLGSMRQPNGSVPNFNDSWQLDPESVERLGPIQPATGFVHLSESGYAVFRSDRLYAVVDVGDPCPDALPGHAHADCLSMELSVDGQRVLVNGAVSRYGTGPIRDEERSTRSHNTVEIDGISQTEVFGGFRAGRRARPREISVRQGTLGETVLDSAHDGYQHLAGRPIHRRTFTFRDESIEIVDVIESGSAHDAVAQWHIDPNLGARRIGDEIFHLGPVEIELSARTEVISKDLAMTFGLRLPVDVLTCAFGTREVGYLRTKIRVVPLMGDSLEPILIEESTNHGN